jgi:hypothetical protein
MIHVILFQPLIKSYSLFHGFGSGKPDSLYLWFVDYRAHPDFSPQKRAAGNWIQFRMDTDP